MLAAGMYLKNIGAFKKPVYIVPNHLTEQWSKEFYRFFPQANILITTKKDFEARNRNKFVSRIAMGEYDAVIIGHLHIPVFKGMHGGIYLNTGDFIDHFSYGKLQNGILTLEYI